jgi:xanthine/CO dehydrogenase XdhC/CoxF family maturation factor
MGLPIHSQTPAEIAVSIAAQLIRIRNEPTHIAPRSSP